MTARILVVDDDAAIAEMIGIVLRGEGFEPHFSFDGIAAIEAFASVKPDLVLLDLMLPGIDGIQVCTRIRETSGTDRKSTRLNSSHSTLSRMPSSA